MARNAGSFNTYNGETGRLDETLFHPALETKTAAQWIAENKVLVNGEMVQESDTKLIKIGDGVTAYKSLKHYGKHDVFAIRMGSDFVPSTDVEAIPFGISLGENEKSVTDFAEVMGDGKVKIKKAGYYRISGQLFISDASGMQGAFHFGVRRQRDGYLFAENYNIASTRQGLSQCSSNFCRDCYFGLNDVLSVTIFKPTTNVIPYRIDGTFTTFSITPIYI